ncbi:MAG: EamA family transporter, partial [Candidatus Ornithomonoglobus sp.]
ATGALSFDISPLSWSVSAVISFLVTLGAMPLFQLGVRYEGASTAGILSTVEPITSVIMGAVFLGENVSASQMMGGAMILLGVLLAEKAPHHKKQAA